jgi:hypothetical protein
MCSTLISENAVVHGRSNAKKQDQGGVSLQSQQEQNKLRFVKQSQHETYEDVLYRLQLAPCHHRYHSLSEWFYLPLFTVPPSKVRQHEAAKQMINDHKARELRAVVVPPAHIKIPRTGPRDFASYPKRYKRHFDVIFVLGSRLSPGFRGKHHLRLSDVLLFR